MSTHRDVVSGFGKNMRGRRSLGGNMNVHADHSDSVDAIRGEIHSLDARRYIKNPVDADASNSVDAGQRDIFPLDARRHNKKACRRQTPTL